MSAGPDTVAHGEAISRRFSARGVFVHALGIGTFYALVFIFFAVRSPHFLEYSNFTAILANVAVLGVVSIGQALTIISGGFDVSVSGTLALGSVTYAYLVNDGLNWPLATMLAILTGAAVGLVNGFVIARLGVNPLITTLATLSIAGGLAYTITGGLTIVIDNDSAAVWGDRAFRDIQWGGVAFAILAVVAFLVLRYTVYGRALYALGGNREASRLAGIRVGFVTASVYVICGACAAFAGVIVASQLFAGTPTVGVDANLRSITAVILGGAALTGGVGGIPGTLLGVLLLGTITNGMALMQVQAFYQQIATGVVLLLAVGFGSLRARMART